MNARDVFAGSESGPKVMKTPKSWLACAPFSSECIAGKFLAFKTPLAKEFSGKLKDKEFNVKSVFDYLEEEKLEMGLWIDLSIPVRFGVEEVISRGCWYLKVRCGMKKKRFSATANMIIDTIREFIKACPDKIIGVHCTRGLNRTGFIIVSAMIEIYGWELEEAIVEFAKVRPPGMNKDLMSELRKRYGISQSPDKLPALSGRTGEGQNKNVKKEREVKATEEERNWREHGDGPDLHFKNPECKKKNKSHPQRKSSPKQNKNDRKEREVKATEEERNWREHGDGPNLHFKNPECKKKNKSHPQRKSSPKQNKNDRKEREVKATEEERNWREHRDGPNLHFKNPECKQKNKSHPQIKSSQGP